MSRTRALKDPFWATAIGKMQPGPARIVRGLHCVVQRSKLLAPYLWFGSGWRTGSTEHDSGRAIDIMVTETTGRRPTPAEHAAAMALIAFLINNSTRLGIQWILYSTDGQNRTQSWNADRRTWKNLANRGSISANHVDHIHVYFKLGADWPSSLTMAVIGATTVEPATPTPGLPSTGAPGWDGKTFPGTSAFRTGKKHPAVKLLQERLVAHGYDVGGVDSYWGAKTLAATRRFQLAQGWTGSGADGVPGPMTWARLLAAPKPRPGKSISQMAAEVIAGKHGNGHDRRRRSLGIDQATYARVRAEVNRRT